jgi:uncharacterized protein YcfJ
MTTLSANIRFLLGASALVLATQAAAQVTFYEGEGYRGRAFTTSRPVGNFERYGFNDRASSAVVTRGRWEACEDAGFGGRCILLRPGSYESLAAMGMNNRVSSVRPADPRRNYEYEAPAPVAAPTYEYRRRPDERVFEAPVVSVRAVMGPPDRRCWVERQEVREPNAGGAILGGIIGGVLGHQVGSGRGNDAATVGGALAGAAIGSNAGGDRVGARDVRRCESTASGPPAYWDVTYNFRGTDHLIQMSAPPGRTILVNARGEPRQ